MAKKPGVRLVSGIFIKSGPVTGIAVASEVFQKFQWFRAGLELEKFCVAKFLMAEKLLKFNYFKNGENSRFQRPPPLIFSRKSAIS